MASRNHRVLSKSVDDIVIIKGISCVTNTHLLKTKNECPAKPCHRDISENNHHSVLSFHTLFLLYVATLLIMYALSKRRQRNIYQSRSLPPTLQRTQSTNPNEFRGELLFSFLTSRMFIAPERKVSQHNPTSQDIIQKYRNKESYRERKLICLNTNLFHTSFGIACVRIYNRRNHHHLGLAESRCSRPQSLTNLTLTILTFV